MATILRLRRTGTTNVATFRLVATDQRCRRDGKFIEILGHYDPRREGDEKLVADAERIQYWIDNGALISDAVRPLLKSIGIIPPVKTSKRKKKKAVETPAPASAPAEESVEPSAPETPVAATVTEETVAVSDEEAQEDAPTDNKTTDEN